MSRTVKNPRRRGCKHGFPCGWCISNRALSREADGATREALRLAHDADALGVLHPAELRLIECDAAKRDATCGELCRGCLSDSP